MSSARRPPESASEAPLLDAVFGSTPAARSSSGRRPALTIGLLVAIVAHGVLYLVAQAKEPSLETWAANIAALIHADLVSNAATEMAPSPTPASSNPPDPAPPLPQAEPEPADSKALPSPVRPAEQEPLTPDAPPPAPARTESDDSAPPGQAGELLTAEPSSAPVDFTGTFVTGSGRAYAGGATTRTGTGQQANTQVSTRALNPSSSSALAPQPSASRARPVQLPEGRWTCAWPKAALNQDIYEQHVLLRVRVNAEGTVEAVTLLDDPGHGFGAAATACARATRFAPAKDEEGRAVAATSPPIRVRFTR